MILRWIFDFRIQFNLLVVNHLYRFCRIILDFGQNFLAKIFLLVVHKVGFVTVVAWFSNNFGNFQICQLSSEAIGDNTAIMTTKFGFAIFFKSITFIGNKVLSTSIFRRNYFEILHFWLPKFNCLQTTLFFSRSLSANNFNLSHFCLFSHNCSFTKPSNFVLSASVYFAYRLISQPTMDFLKGFWLNLQFCFETISFPVKCSCCVYVP